MHCEGSYSSEHLQKLFCTVYTFLFYLQHLFSFYTLTHLVFSEVTTAGLLFPSPKLKQWWCPRLCLVPCIYHVHITIQLLRPGRFFSACQRPWSPRWWAQSCSCPLPLTCSGSLPGGGSHRWLCCRPSSVLWHCFSGGKGRVSSHSMEHDYFHTLQHHWFCRIKSRLAVQQAFAPSVHSLQVLKEASFWFSLCQAHFIKAAGLKTKSSQIFSHIWATACLQPGIMAMERSRGGSDLENLNNPHFLQKLTSVCCLRCSWKVASLHHYTDH